MQNDMHVVRQESVRQAVEKAVSAYTGRTWKVREFKDLNDLASHPAAILSDGIFPVFVKFSSAANGLEQFEVELSGLQLLSKLSGVRTPRPIEIVAMETDVILILEAVEVVERTSREWRDIGRTLAQIHQVKGTSFGWDTQGYFGPLYQDNRLLPDWPTFYTERRLWPRLMGAIDSGHLSSSLIQQIEKIILKLPDLCGPTIQPTLLHGDAQQNNFISTAHGAVAIDPAIHYGHPEIDLAYVDYFQPTPEDVFLGYTEILPIDPGFSERCELWRIPAYLAVVQVAGPAYLEKLMEAVQKYL